jgi:uncharacterized membrane protein
VKQYRIIIALAAAALSLFALGLSGCAGKPKGEGLAPRDGVFRVDARTIGAGEVKFFHYRSGGKYVVFLVARSDSGDIKAAFDACMTCYPHRMGYRQDGDSVVCNFCGNRFRLEELNKGIGNCVPISINYRMEGSDVIIDQNDIMAGSAWF